MGLSAQQLSQPLRLGHLRGDPRRLLRCLERPHGQIRGHRLNWNQRWGTGQDLARLVLRVAGVSLDKLASQFDLRRDAIHRHCKNHLTERARISYLAGPAAIADLANAAARENRSVLEYLTV